MKDLFYKIPLEKQMRVVIDTDAACECDDQYAIVHALLSPNLHVQGILAEHFGNREADTMEQSYQEILRIADMLGFPRKKIFRGVSGALADEDMGFEEPMADERMGCRESLTDGRMKLDVPAVDFLIREAREETDEPLFVLCQGALSNVASAILKAPDICGRMQLVIVGGANYPNGGYEFNTMNDRCAFNVVMNSSVPCWMIPDNVYGTMQVGMFELMDKVYPHGELGKYLVGHTFDVLQSMTKVVPNFSEFAPYDYAIGFPNGAAWSLGDSCAVGVLLSHLTGHYREVPAPNVNPDGSYFFPENSKLVRWYDDVNGRFILEDFFAKLKFYEDGVR